MTDISSRRTGILYVVATPIGNLDDISPRARAVLEAVDLVAAEDTRRVRRLLARFGIRNTLLSVHEHNESARVGQLLERIVRGQDIALVSDAGTPLVSDPGYRLVAAARAQNLPVTPVPGSCALIAALSVAGLPSDRFRFEGFLPARRAARRTALQALVDCPQTLIFYESVHRIMDTLEDMVEVFGAQRPATLARELTKLHETLYRGSLADVRAALADDPGGDRGELTLVVGGTGQQHDSDAAELRRVVNILAAELPAGQAATLAARLTGARRREAYRLAMAHGGDACPDGDDALS